MCQRFWSHSGNKIDDSNGLKIVWGNWALSSFLQALARHDEEYDKEDEWSDAWCVSWHQLFSVCHCKSCVFCFYIWTSLSSHGQHWNWSSRYRKSQERSFSRFVMTSKHCKPMVPSMFVCITEMTLAIFIALCLLTAGGKLIFNCFHNTPFIIHIFSIFFCGPLNDKGQTTL